MLICFKSYRKMWFVDSLTKHITAFDFDLASGTVSNPRVAIDFGVDAALGVRVWDVWWC